MCDLKLNKQQQDRNISFSIRFKFVRIWRHIEPHMVGAGISAGLEPCFHAVQNTLKRTARPVKGIWVPGGNPTLMEVPLEIQLSDVFLQKPGSWKPLKFHKIPT